MATIEIPNFQYTPLIMITSNEYFLWFSHWNISENISFQKKLTGKMKLFKAICENYRKSLFINN